MPEYPNPFAGAFVMDVENLPEAYQAQDGLGFLTTELGFQHAIATAMQALWFQMHVHQTTNPVTGREEREAVAEYIKENAATIADLSNKLLAHRDASACH